MGAEGWGLEGVSVHVMIQKRKMEIYHGLIMFPYNSQFVECYCRTVSCFCSVQESKHNLNIHVHITTLQKLFFLINKMFKSKEMSRGFYKHRSFPDYLRKFHFKHCAVNLWMEVLKELILQKLNFYEIHLLLLLNNSFRCNSQTEGKLINVKRKLSKQKQLWIHTVDDQCVYKTQWYIPSRKSTNTKFAN